MGFIIDSAHVWHVAKTGNDGNGGHAQQYPINLANDAKLTIGAAITAAAAGDTIVIWPGTYAENVSTTKTLHLVGASNYKSIIQPASGVALLFDTGSDGSTADGLVCNGGGTGADSMGIKINVSDIKITDCMGYGYQNGIYLATVNRIQLRNVYGKSEYDAVQLGHASEVLLDGCVAEALGVKTGSTSRALTQNFNSKNVVVRNTILKATIAASGSDSCIGADCAGHIVFRDCAINVDTSQTPSGYAAGVVAGTIALSNAVVLIKNCNIRVSAGGGSWYGVYTPYKEIYLLDSLVSIKSGGNSLKQEGSAVLQVASDRYDAGATSGIITYGPSGWAAAVNAEVDTALSDVHLDKAAKSLVNKAVQNKATGAIEYYDDDGETIILTHTPSDGESAITRTPS